MSQSTNYDLNDVAANIPVKAEHLEEAAKLRDELGTFSAAVDKYTGLVLQENDIAQVRAKILKRKIDRAVEIRAWSLTYDTMRKIESSGVSEPLRDYMIAMGLAQYWDGSTHVDLGGLMIFAQPYTVTLVELLLRVRNGDDGAGVVGVNVGAGFSFFGCSDVLQILAKSAQMNDDNTIIIYKANEKTVVYKHNLITVEMNRAWFEIYANIVLAASFKNRPYDFKGGDISRYSESGATSSDWWHPMNLASALLNWSAHKARITEFFGNKQVYEGAPDRKVILYRGYNPITNQGDADYNMAWHTPVSLHQRDHVKGKTKGESSYFGGDYSGIGSVDYVNLYTILRGPSGTIIQPNTIEFENLLLKYGKAAQSLQVMGHHKGGEDSTQQTDIRITEVLDGITYSVLWSVGACSTLNQVSYGWR